MLQKTPRRPRKTGSWKVAYFLILLVAGGWFALSSFAPPKVLFLFVVISTLAPLLPITGLRTIFGGMEDPAHDPHDHFVLMSLWGVVQMAISVAILCYMLVMLPWGFSGKVLFAWCMSVAVAAGIVTSRKHDDSKSH